MSLGVRLDYSGLLLWEGWIVEWDFSQVQANAGFSSVWYGFFSKPGMRNPSCLGKVFPDPTLGRLWVLNCFFSCILCASCGYGSNGLVHKHKQNNYCFVYICLPSLYSLWIVHDFARRDLFFAICNIMHYCLV